MTGYLRKWFSYHKILTDLISVSGEITCVGYHFCHLLKCHTLLFSHQVQDMIKMLGTEKHSDTDSLTDSGKGPSEHGEDGMKRKKYQVL